MTLGFNFVALLFLINFFLPSSSAASDTLSPTQYIVDRGDTLVSSGGTFELGFFSPPGPTRRYVGIWYKNILPQTVVWVANRSNPLNTTSGVLNLTGDGNLSLHGGASVTTFWTTNTSSLTNPTVQLLDSGNLILSDESSTTRWQSFDHPSDTLIPGMLIGSDPSINLDRRLTSWKDATDPSPGVYTLGVYPRAAPDLYIRNGSETELRSGPWDGTTWGGSPVFKSRAPIDNKYTPPNGTQGGGFYSIEMVNASQIARIVMDESGKVRMFQWLNQQWTLFWVGPTTLCDAFSHCGRFGLCDNQDSPVCKCLPGFVSRSQENFGPSDGPVCTRRTPLNCTAAGDGFLNVPAVKLPATANAAADGSKTFEECRGRCLSDCNCTGFAFFGGSSGCVSWSGDLMDVKQWPLGAGRDFYVRVAASELPSPDQGNGRNTRLIIIIILPIVLFISGTLGCISWTRRHRRKERRQTPKERSRFSSGSTILLNFEGNEGGIKSPLFHSSTINIATNSFSEENKLGEGGFGPVYKGRLHDGQEIAVKRLATHSGQGIQEFENEILLIAKLQHVNLVRLLGCCIQDEEKMLVYEYMPNKSLDFYIFDSTKQLRLSWQMRFHIIEGIAQGLSYLHKHSRLRIIHRDLKASNILLDSDMNPKISDFGIARIFGSNEVQEQTRKVIGTYGYMAPEYAAEGLFSIKSDVFSFGVLLLEIITGKRNNYIYQSLNSQTLLGHAWALWIESRWIELVDPSLDGTCNMNEIRRCIHVALMCVQESFVERPTMSEVVTTLSSENIPLTEPKQPAFFNLRAKAREGLVQDISKGSSVYDMTITTLESR